LILVPLGFLADERPDTPGFWSFALILVGVLIGMLRTRQHHSRVADHMVRLRAQPGPEDLRALLASSRSPPLPNDNRRVHAVLAFVRETEHQPAR
jgi:hypothetical protein